jgi:hypothetical protein
MPHDEKNPDHDGYHEGFEEGWHAAIVVLSKAVVAAQDNDYASVPPTSRRRGRGIQGGRR